MAYNFHTRAGRPDPASDRDRDGVGDGDGGPQGGAVAYNFHTIGDVP
jgi:hypothetical protein